MVLWILNDARPLDELGRASDLELVHSRSDSVMVTRDTEALLARRLLMEDSNKPTVPPLRQSGVSLEVGLLKELFQSRRVVQFDLGSGETLKGRVNAVDASSASTTFRDG